MKTEKFRYKKKQKISLQQMHFLCRQLSFALAGGISLPYAITLAASEIHPKVCAQFLNEIGEKVRAGQSMAQAVQESRIRYSPVFLEFILAGEQNGSMAETMVQAAEYFARQHHTRQMLTSALFYPAVLCVLMVCALGAMFLFVVPTVIQTYDNFDAPLPAATRSVLQISEWLANHWMLVMILFAAAVLGGAIVWKHIRRKSFWQKRISYCILHIPVAGKLYQQYWFVQLSQAMGLMLSGGMLLSDCSQTLLQIYQRSLFAAELEYFSRKVSEGYMFGDALAECSFIPSMARQMLMVSEQSGALPEALLQLSQYYQQLLQQKLHRLAGMLEPCFVIILGLGILFMTGSLFLPMVQSYQYLLG